MAIQLKGEVQSASGKTLVLNYQALTTFEEISGESAFDIFGQLDTGSVPRLSVMRDFIVAALSVRYPDATAQDAYDILNDEPDVFYKLIQASMPKADDVSETGDTKKKTTKKAPANTNP